MSSEAQLRRLLHQYGILPESECGQGLLRFLALLEKWNCRINLVSSTRWEILGPLFEEGIWASQYYPPGPIRHLDIGSGSGFPAFPLRLIRPEIRLCMIESRTRRAVFLETVCEALALQQASVFHGTLEAFLKGPNSGKGWDCISWKAIKLRRRDFSALAGGAAAGTAFWIFQGADIPVEGGVDGHALKLECSRKFPGKPAWQLSVYRKVPPSNCFT